MKSVVNYSINVKVLEAFNDEVKDQTRSRLIEALMIEFLVNYTQGKSPEVMVGTPITTKEIP